MKPTDLDDATPVEPDVDVLGRVHARSGVFRRRRTAQRVVTAATAVLVVVLAVGIAFARVHSEHPGVNEPASNTTTTAPAVAEDARAGPWSPVTIASWGGALTAPPLRSAPRLAFGADGVLTGSDGCNDLGDSYRLGADGAFHVSEFSSTAVGCPQTVPIQEMLGAAARVTVSEDRLTFLAADGRELAIFSRAVVTARIELPSNTMVAGTTMSGQLVVDNETGHVIPAFGCISLFQVVLRNATYQPDIAWDLCRQPLDVPNGVSRYLIMVSASTSNCTTGPPSDGIPSCSPRNLPPPLAPGRYEATLYQSTHVVPDPAPIRVDVVVSGADSAGFP